MESTNDFCYAEFLAYYTFESKSNNTCDYQPHELHDNLTENNHEKYFYSKQIKLMNSGEKKSGVYKVRTTFDTMSLMKIYGQRYLLNM